jgi:hypothetical protein
MYRTLHGLTLIFPNSTESVGLAAKYGYDEWVVGHFLDYVPPEVSFSRPLLLRAELKKLILIFQLCGTTSTKG